MILLFSIILSLEKLRLSYLRFISTLRFVVQIFILLQKNMASVLSFENLPVEKFNLDTPSLEEVAEGKNSLDSQVEHLSHSLFV